MSSISENSSNNSEDNIELCRLLLNEYKKVKSKLSNEQKQKSYFSILFDKVPNKYKTRVTTLVDDDSLYGIASYISDYPLIEDNYEKFLKSIGIKTEITFVTVFGYTLQYLDVYYGSLNCDNKEEKCKHE